MKKIIILTASVFMLTSCGKISQADAQLNGYSSICVDGITYLQFTSGATAKIDSNGKPVKCVN